MQWLFSKRRGAVAAPKGAMYIGRPTRWGNQTKMLGDAFIDQVLAMPSLAEDLHDLRGKPLVCWCYPRPCHGNILLWLANAPEDRDPRELLEQLRERLRLLPDVAARLALISSLGVPFVPVVDV